MKRINLVVLSAFFAFALSSCNTSNNRPDLDNNQNNPNIDQNDNNNTDNNDNNTENDNNNTENNDNNTENDNNNTPDKEDNIKPEPIGKLYGSAYSEGIYSNLTVTVIDKHNVSFDFNLENNNLENASVINTKYDMDGIYEIVNGNYKFYFASEKDGLPSVIKCETKFIRGTESDFKMDYTLNTDIGNFTFNLMGQLPRKLGDYGAMLFGTTHVAGLDLNATISILADNKALLDYEFQGDLPQGLENFNETLDMEGSYIIRNNNYYFSFKPKSNNETNKEVHYTATYMINKDYTHELKAQIMTDLGPKEIILIGNLPLKEDTPIYKDGIITSTTTINNIKYDCSILLIDDHTALFDFNPEPNKLNNETIESNLTNNYDMYGTYFVKNYEYYFAFENQNSERLNYIVKHISEGSFTHELICRVETKNESISFQLVGNLPLVEDTPNTENISIGTLKGRIKVANINGDLTLDVFSNNKAVFDVTFEHGNFPTPEMEQRFNKILDMNGTYKIVDKDYLFSFDKINPDGQVEKINYIATYVSDKEYTHEFTYSYMTDLGQKEEILVGNLPL